MQMTIPKEAFMGIKNKETTLPSADTLRSRINDRVDAYVNDFVTKCILGIALGIAQIDDGQGVSLEEAKQIWRIA